MKHAVPLQPPMPRVSNRDPAPWALALLLALLALPASGWVEAAWLPRTPAGFQRLALLLTALACLAQGGTGRPRRVALLVLAAVPALIFGLLGGGALPAAAWWGVLVLAAGIGALPHGRTAALAGVVALLALGAVLAEADAGRWLEQPRPSEPEGVAPEAPVSGVRLGAPVQPADGATPALAAGAGPWWVEAQRATHPGARPVVLVLAGARPQGSAWALPQATVVYGDEHAFQAAHDLRPFDAVVALERAWGEDDAQAAARARAVMGFVRGGGLLIGPAGDARWPPRLGPLLGTAGRARATGVGGVRRLGLGRVARAAHQRDVAALFDADLWVRDVNTSLLDRGARPAPLATWAPWRDEPTRRRTQGLLLLLHAVALLVFTRLLRGGGSQLLGTLLVAGAMAAGLAWSAPEDPGFRVTGAFVELGGRGGRRVEAVWISAGPAGYRGHVRFQGEGVVAHRGGRLGADGRFVVEPGHGAWVVRETRAGGARPEEPEDRTQAAAMALLRGSPSPARLRIVRSAGLPVRVEGWGPVPAAGVLVGSAGR